MKNIKASLRLLRKSIRLRYDFLKRSGKSQFGDPNIIKLTKEFDSLNNIIKSSKDCPRCSGEGKLICTECHGDGIVKK